MSLLRGSRRPRKARQPDLWSSIPTSTRQAITGEVLRRAQGRCEIRAPGCKVVATDADHIIPWSVDPSRLLDLTNLRAACTWCNRGKRGRMTASPSGAW